MKLLDKLKNDTCVVVYGETGKSSFARYIAHRVGRAQFFYSHEATRSRGDRLRIVELNGDPPAHAWQDADVVVYVTESGALVERSKICEIGEFLPAQEYV